MNSDEQQFETEFVTPNKLSKLLGMPRNQVMKDIHSGRLHAFKRGKSYYVPILGILMLRTSRYPMGWKYRNP